MKLNLNGVEIVLPNNAKVDVSKDGKKVVIELPDGEVQEKIRVVEVPVAGAPTERIIERIKVVEVEVEKPCTRPHYDYYVNPPYTITTSGGNTIHKDDWQSYIVVGNPDTATQTVANPPNFNGIPTTIMPNGNMGSGICSSGYITMNSPKVSN